MAFGTAIYGNSFAAPTLGSPFLAAPQGFAPAALDRLGGMDPTGQLRQVEGLIQTATLAVLVSLLGRLMQNQQQGGAGASSALGGGASDAGGGGGSASGGSSAAGGTDAAGGGSSASGGGNLSTNSNSPSKNGFAEALLQKIGAPVTPENLKFLDAWQKAEGGSADNPFNTTQDAPGARNFNSVGVKRYQSMEQGLEATAKTLMNGRYGNIIAALRQGNSAKSAADALAASPWGTGALVQKILA